MLFLSIDKIIVFYVFAKSIDNIKYSIKRHITSLGPCVSSKHSLAYSLYSHKSFYWDDRCGRGCESVSVYLISMFSSCSTFKNRLTFHSRK